MKKLLFLIAVFISANVLCARDNSSQSAPDMNFYGIDFSLVKIFGAKESQDKFIQAFEGINKLIVAEPNKYPWNTFFTKFAGKIDRSAEMKNLKFDAFQNVTVEEAIYKARTIDKSGMITYNNLSKIDDKQLADLVKTFKTGRDSGYGVIYVAELLDRKESTGKYILLCFNVKTKKIIFAERVQGKAGGMGLRNYWAGSLADIFKI
jgi:hypothetical protein